jgi:signal transduction histidine kinase
VQVVRYVRVYDPVQRQQTKWLLFGLVIFLLLNTLYRSVENLVPGFSDPDSIYQLADGTVTALLFVTIPLAIGVAILRYRLFDIDLIINRTLVYGTLSASVIGVYVLVVVYLGALLRTGNNPVISLVATGLVAVLFQPLRSLLQRAINRLMYGERDDPYAVLARLGSRLEATLVPEKVLPTIVETVAQALKLPYVAIALLPEQRPVTGTAGAMAVAGTEAPDMVASYGAPTADPMQVPLMYQAETIGYLLLAARAGDTFGKADERLLADLARQAGVAVHAVRLTTHLQGLTESLQQARERLVTTREEERRRLRRDLHDGLGPALASLTFKVDAARNLLAQDSARADRLLAEIRQQAQDEFGLLSALREQAAHYQHQGLEVAFDAPQSLPPLPAAVEVAAYRIAQEALTNVARHAQALHCSLWLAIDAEAVQLTISDDGQGIPAGHRIGVGLHAMHERASELGGSCTITQGPSGGTAIQVRLPRVPATNALPAFAQETKQLERANSLASDVSLVRQEE